MRMPLPPFGMIMLWTLLACATSFGLSTNHNGGTYDNDKAYNHSRKIEVLKDSKMRET
jgi:hypothetical protein